MSRKMRKGGKAFLLAVYLSVALGLLGGCGGTANNAVNNTVNDSFYERADQGIEESGERYSENMDKIYGDTLDRLMDTDEEVEQWEGKDIFDKTTRKVLTGWQRAYHTFRTLSPMICVISICLGILMYRFFKTDKGIRKVGLFTFVIAIPLVVIVIVFGVGIMNGMLLY